MFCINDTFQSSDNAAVSQKVNFSWEESYHIELWESISIVKESLL